jgi:hypothetical protein
MSERGVIFHDVPEDRPVTDINHGFGDIFGIIPHPGAQAAAEKNYFHDYYLIAYLHLKGHMPCMLRLTIADWSRVKPVPGLR